MVFLSLGSQFHIRVTYCTHKCPFGGLELPQTPLGVPGPHHFAYHCHDVTPNVGEITSIGTVFIRILNILPIHLLYISLGDPEILPNYNRHFVIVLIVRILLVCVNLRVLKKWLSPCILIQWEYIESNWEIVEDISHIFGVTSWQVNKTVVANILSMWPKREIRHLPRSQTSETSRSATSSQSVASWCIEPTRSLPQHVASAVSLSWACKQDIFLCATPSYNTGFHMIALRVRS